MVGFSKSHHSETVSEPGISINHSSRQVNLTMSLPQTSFQLRDDSKYVLRSTKAFVASSRCCLVCLVCRAHLTKLVRMGMKCLRISEVLVSYVFATTSESRQLWSMPCVGFKKSRPHNGRIVSDLTFRSIWNFGTP